MEVLFLYGRDHDDEWSDDETKLVAIVKTMELGQLFVSQVE